MSQTPSKSFHASRIWQYSLMAAILVAGTLCAWWLALRTDNEMRHQLLHQAGTIAEAVDINSINALTGTRDDLASPEYLRLKDQFAAIRAATPQCRFVYLMGRKKDPAETGKNAAATRLFFFLDSEPAGAKEESPAGQEYEEAQESFFKVFDTRKAVVVGPVTDRWGTWFSALIPLVQPGSDEVIAVLGMDMDANDWNMGIVARSATPTGLATLALLVILFAGSFLLNRRFPSQGRKRRKMRHLEAALAAAIGLVLTAFFAWLAQHEAERSQAEAFRHLAESRSAALAEAFHIIQRMELEGLARFYEESEQVTSAEFQNYAAYLARNQAVQAWEWIPAVTSADKERFEREAREAGIENFTIWQKNAGDQIQPATGRDIYYPVFRVTPEKGNLKAVGYDLCSEPVRCAGLKSALETGLTTASDPVELVQNTGSQKALLVFRPVYADKEQRSPRGLVLAVLRLDDLLPSAGPEAPVHEELILARPVKPFELLAPSNDDHSQLVGLKVQRPVLAFGKTFLLRTQAKKGFLQIQPANAGHIVGMTGLVLTLSVTIVLSVLLRRRQELEELVLERTAALRKSEEELSATLRSLGEGVITCDLQGKVLSINDAAESLTGWNNDEVSGLPLGEVFNFLNNNTQETAELLVERVITGDNSISAVNNSIFINREGLTRRVALSCAAIHDMSGVAIGAVLVFRDVTDEYQRREELRESEAFLRELLLSLPAGVIIVDPVTREIELLNNHAAGLYGAPVEHLLGKRCHALLCPAAENACPVCDLGNSIDNSERVLLRADGSPLPILKTVKRVLIGGKEKLLECFVDISDRIRAEQEAKEASLRLSLATEAGGVGVWDYDIAQDKLDWDEQMYQLYGKDTNDFAGTFQDWSNSVHPEDQERGEREIQMALRGEQEFHTEFRIIWPDGSIRHIRAMGAVIRDENHAPIRMIGTNWDITDQKRAEEALRLSEQKARAVLDMSFQLMGMLSTDGKLIEVNQTALDLVKVSKSEVMDKPFWEGPWWKHSTELQEKIRNAVQTAASGESVRFEVTNLRAEGWVDYLDFSLKPVLDETGKVLFLLPEGHVITDRKLAEEKLADERWRLSSIIEGANVGTWEWNVKTGKTVFNDIWADIVGYTLEELQPTTIQTWEDLAHPRDLEQSTALLQKHFSGELPYYDMECRMKHKDGHWVWIHDRGRLMTRDSKGAPLLMFGTHQDVTSRKLAEEHLQQALLEQSAILENASVGITLVQDRVLRKTNKKMAEMFGHDIEEMQNQTTRLLFLSQEEYEAFGQEAYPVVDRGGIYTSECLMRRKDGERFWVRLVGTAIDPLALEAGYIWVYEDISEAKLREQELEKARTAAEEASRMKSEFLANMSHEIRTPMNGVIGMTSLLTETRLTAEQKHFVKSIKLSGELLLELINDILDFSKIEAGRLELENLNFDLLQLLDDFLDSMAMRASEKGLELLSFATPDTPPLLRGDAPRVRQILTNLVGNAIKFTSKGQIVVRIEALEVYTDQCLLQISVEDTGIGIAQDKLDLLFDKFSQVDASTTRKYGGTGLGLAISKQLAELMGGAIGVRSLAGQGSIFWFTLRLERQKSAHSETYHTSPDLKGVRILIVDDNHTNREILMKRLTSWGFAPDQTDNADEALQILHRERNAEKPFSLALIDMQMPGKTGYDLGMLIKNDPELHQLKTILLSSIDEQGAARHYKDAGFMASTTKPVRHGDFLQMITRVLRGEEDDTAPSDRSDSVMGNQVADSTNQKRVLLVEDNAINQQVASGIIKRCGLQVDIASNGLQALETLGKNSYDLVFMDIQMPEMDGFETTRRIRSSEDGTLPRAIPIVAMTAHAMQGDREKCLSAGMNDYISKPINKKELVDILEKWLQQQMDPSSAPGGDAPGNARDFPEISGVSVQEGLSALDIDHDTYRTLLLSLRDDARLALGKLAELVASNAIADVEKLAHRLAGTAANLRAFQLMDAAKNLELATQQGGFNGEQLGTLEEALRSYVKAVEILEAGKPENTGVFDPQSAGLILEKIAMLVADSEFVDANIINRLEHALPSRVAPDELAKLKKCLQNFAYDEAKGLIATIQSELTALYPTREL